jgi:hypothetical protein
LTSEKKRIADKQSKERGIVTLNGLGKDERRGYQCPLSDAQDEKDSST